VHVVAGAAPRRPLLATAAASTGNYVVPLDAAPLGITHPLIEILCDLNKRVPDTIVIPASPRASASDPVVPWYSLCPDRVSLEILVNGQSAVERSWRCLALN
jgi:hypothetical protein